MGRELQKKKNRSSVNKVRQKPKSKRLANPRGNAIIAANWDPKQTLTQNYRRLGLASRLNAATGGLEKKGSEAASLKGRQDLDTLAIDRAFPKSFAPTEARVERDPETGKIVRVVHPEASRRAPNPLNDPLASDEDDGDFEGFGSDDAEGASAKVQNRDVGIIKLLEEQAAMVAPKKPRKQSAREQEWVQALVEKYGDDTSKMFRDRKLNPMQQTEADLKKRIEKWKASGRE